MSPIVEFRCPTCGKARSLPDTGAQVICFHDQKPHAGRVPQVMRAAHNADVPTLGLAQVQVRRSPKP